MKDSFSLKKTENYEIRLARKDEGDLLMDFLRKYWNPNHALAKSKELFDFQHLSGNHYNVIVGFNVKTQEIDGIQALISVDQYDSNLNKYGNYWGAILKVRNDIDNPESKRLALYLIGCVFKLPDFKKLISIGMGPLGLATIRPWLKENGILHHYYLANTDCSEFKIGRKLVQKNHIQTSCRVEDVDISLIEDIPESIYKPQKSLQYLINRYYKHPIYRYGFWGVYVDNQLSAIFVIRVANVCNIGNCIHIVDCVGNLDEVGNLGNSINEQLKKIGAEYVDIVNYGISPDKFREMGFEELDLDQEEVIVPNFFEPFERKNVVIRYAINPEQDYVIFRADADQDRPSII